MSQRGVLPLHWASAVQATQRPALVPDNAHSGVGAAHSLLLAQSRQVRAAGSHTGSDAGQSLLTVHATHVRLTVSQRGVAPLHWESLRQPTHWLVVMSHRPSAPQSPSLRHATQRPLLVPDVAHTGVLPLHWALLEQPDVQVRVLPSQNGACIGQSVLERQPTQVSWPAPDAVLHTPRGVSHAVSSVAVHSTQRPAREPCVSQT